MTYDPTGAKAGRDFGMALVIANNKAFRQAYFDRVNALKFGWTGTNEDIREIFDREGLPQPAHHNAWGACCGVMQRKKILAKTGRRTPMSFKQSHARPTDVLVKVTASTLRDAPLPRYVPGQYYRQ